MTPPAAIKGDAQKALNHCVHLVRGFRLIEVAGADRPVRATRLALPVPPVLSGRDQASAPL
jgi:hypothetical protein